MDKLNENIESTQKLEPAQATPITHVINLETRVNEQQLSGNNLRNVGHVEITVLEEVIMN